MVALNGTPVTSPVIPQIAGHLDGGVDCLSNAERATAVVVLPWGQRDFARVIGRDAVLRDFGDTSVVIECALAGELQVTLGYWIR